jgi:hypothetical protein
MAAIGNRNLGFKLLAVWLILSGVTTFIGGVAGIGFVLGALAIISGALILSGR